MQLKTEFIVYDFVQNDWETVFIQEYWNRIKIRKIKNTFYLEKRILLIK